MKKVSKIVNGILLMVLGAMLYGFIGEAAEAYGSRGIGNVGGEVLVIPLIIGLIALGWQIRENVHK